MTIHALDVDLRDPKVSPYRKLIKTGEIPAILHHKHGPDIPLRISSRIVETLFRSPVSLVKLHFLNSNGKDQSGTKKEDELSAVTSVQRDPVSHRVIHVNFEGVESEEPVTLHLPLYLDHDPNCGWVKKRGTMVQKLTHLNVKFSLQPKNEIPEQIRLNIDHLDIGGVLHVSELDLSKQLGLPNVEIMDNPRAEIVTITQSRAPEVSEPS